MATLTFGMPLAPKPPQAPSSGNDCLRARIGPARRRRDGGGPGRRSSHFLSSSGRKTQEGDDGERADGGHDPKGESEVGLRDRRFPAKAARALQDQSAESDPKRE